jgi:hypothetical protein
VSSRAFRTAPIMAVGPERRVRVRCKRRPPRWRKPVSPTARSVQRQRLVYPILPAFRNSQPGFGQVMALN